MTAVSLIRDAGANGRPNELRTKLSRLALFKELRPHELDALAGELEWQGLPGGWVLFREGEQDDSLFVVVAGRLGVVTADSEGRETIISHITPGETVGEMALLSGSPRSATVVAMRDSELLRLTKQSFELLAERHPAIMRFITRLLVQRLERTSHRTAATGSCSTIAIVPLTRAIDPAEFARALEGALGELGTRVIAVDRRAAERDTEWFTALEEAHDTVLYQADYDPSEWTRLCVRQADRILLLAAAERPPESEPPALSVMPAAVRGEQIEMVFIHGSGAPRTQRIEEMLARFNVGFHYHVRDRRRADIARVARLISGRAVGLVFSGGGARGFAHIGVMKAFNAAGIPFDMTGGTSMGSMIAGAAALEWELDETVDHLKRAFVLTNPLSDYTLPLVAVVRGRKVSRLLREHFGDALIEDCWRPFFCTSSNLTSGQAKVHRLGPLWRAVRASIAIPGVLPPVIDNNQILIDGGVMNNLPVDVMSAMRRGRVVGVDVAREHVLTADADDLEGRSLWQLLSAKRRGTPNIIGLLMSAGMVNSEAQVKLRRQQVDVLIEPRLGNMGMLDWHSWESAIEQGYRQTMEILEHSRDRLVAPSA
ncbi:MAG TPA: patatin-like phospholipase family protein [Candidatus Binataceae bacterium]|nr:patatin-like phospholipase family protein [Candidatus Binataceae bacterium]